MNTRYYNKQQKQPRQITRVNDRKHIPEQMADLFETSSSISKKIFLSERNINSVKPNETANYLTALQRSNKR